MNSMKRADFLARMYQKKKIQLVNPNENIKSAYLQRSEESLSSAKALLKIGNLKDSVALFYYSMYHCLLALMFRIGIKCENHTAAIIILQDVFGLDSKDIRKAKNDRVDKQYYVDFRITEEEVKETMFLAEDFIADLRDFIERLSEQDIKDYRKLFLALIDRKN